MLSGSISCSLYKKKSNAFLFTVSKEVSITNTDIAETDPEVCRLFYNKGLCANPSYITKDEAKKIKNEDIHDGSYTIFRDNAEIKSFNGFKYFTGINNTDYLPNYVFYNCRSLTSIKLPSSLTQLGSCFFMDCPALESVEIPNSITTIQNSVFVRCSSLKSIEIPDSVVSIGGSVFSGCTSLQSVKLPSSISSMGSQMFRDCTSLLSLRFPSGPTTLLESFFYGCSSLVSVELPETITTIERDCFRGCASLTSIEIPSKVTTLGNRCFLGCLALSTITALPLTAPSTGEECFGNTYVDYTGRNTYNLKINKLYVPSNATGYNAGLWGNPLCNSACCGFTLSKTL